MTDSQYRDFMYEVNAMSDQICKLQVEKTAMNFTSIEMNTSNIKERG